MVAAAHSHYTRTYTYLGTAHLRVAGRHALWPVWVNFLLAAVILLALIAEATWTVRGITRRLRRA